MFEDFSHIDARDLPKKEIEKIKEELGEQAEAQAYLNEEN